jgi:hypothetical protein
VSLRTGELHALGVFPDIASAEVARSLLGAEGIEALIEPSDPISGPIAAGIRGYALLVDVTDRVRARAVLGDSELSEAELIFLATGELPSEDAGEE